MSGPADTIAGQARIESPLWAQALRSPPDWEPVFSPLAPAHLTLGLETIYEAYLVHYGASRLFDSPREEERVLLGDYLYAQGLVKVAEAGGVDAVAVMADLISTCAALRLPAPRATATRGSTRHARSAATPDDDEVARALARHCARVAP